MNTVPIDANRTINRFALIRNISVPLAGKVLNMDLWDKFAVDAMLKCAFAPPPCCFPLSRPCCWWLARLARTRIVLTAQPLKRTHSHSISLRVMRTNCN